MKIAIIGSGISGNGCAWALHPHHDIALYEKEPRLGGHSHTVDVDYDGQIIPVDTGFIVYNTLNYPNLTALFKHLDVATIQSQMSFGLSLNNGEMEWSGGGKSLPDLLNHVFAQRKNILSPRFIKFIIGIKSFNRRASLDLRGNKIGHLTLGAYLQHVHTPQSVIDNYILPMGGAIWSMSLEAMLRFPAISFIQFFHNHRLLYWDHPQWYSVKGGSRSYVEKITAPFKDKIHGNNAVKSILRDKNKVVLTLENGQHHEADHVVLATHTDQALALLQDASIGERGILSAIKYRENTAYLHRDDSLMPRNKRAWSAWNVLRTSQNTSDISLTYWMNILQQIDKKYSLFVSLNPPHPPAENKTFKVMSYEHPQYDAPALLAQKRLDDIQGKNRTWFCGAWTGYGFHEDGLRSGLNIARQLGAKIPWEN